MTSELSINVNHEVLSLVTDITYSRISDWYNAVFTDLKMNLIIPKHRENHSKLPTIVWICGGAFSVVSNTAWIPEMMFFAQKGFVIASIEYRTSNKAPFPAGIIDVKAAIRFLKANASDFCINENQIFVMGESAGGTYACLAGTVNNSQWDIGSNLQYDSSVIGVIDLYGLTNFETTRVIKNEEVPAWSLTAFLGEDALLDNITEASVVNYINPRTVPFLILHGTLDNTVPISQSEELYNKLLKNNVYCEFYKIQNAGHGEDVFYQDEIKQLILKFINVVISN